MDKEEQILISITGQDQPGLTASVMVILARYDANILDIGQADIHSTLSLGILIRIREANSGQMMKELLFKATELGVNIAFTPISDENYEHWVDQQGKNRYIHWPHIVSPRNSMCHKSYCITRIEYRLYFAPYWTNEHQKS